MTKIDIFSGFLGAGKTTLIKKLIKEAYAGEKLVLIENEFGEIGIDGGFLQDAGIQITEMNSGCICCSLVGDFGEALKKVIAEYAPDRVLIEPSGVGKLSDVIRAVQNAGTEGAVLNGFTTVVDANKCKIYMKNFGEFFNDQIENASSVILSHTDTASETKTEQSVKLLREHNPSAVIVTTPWAQLDGAQILEAMENKDTLSAELERLEHESEHEHEHHHDHDHDHEHGDSCTCGCHDHEHEHEHEHEHHHDHEHEHEHHHDHGEECTCGCHDHDHEHHHHHHADEVFSSWGIETTAKYTREQIENILTALMDESKFGIVLRAKGIVASPSGEWIHFDYVPGEPDVRFGTAAVTGRLCVIGSKIDEAKLKELFNID